MHCSAIYCAMKLYRRDHNVDSLTFWYASRDADNPIYASGYCSHNSNSRYEYRPHRCYIWPYDEREDYKITICLWLLSKSPLSFSVSSTITPIFWTAFI